MTLAHLRRQGLLSDPPTRPSPQKARQARLALPSTLTWVVLLLVLAAVGWVQLRHFEARLHEVHEAGRGGGGSDERSGEQQGQLQKQQKASSSARCAALLDERGILPYPKDALLAAAGGGQTGGQTGGGDVGAAVNLLVSRRRLYDAMEASLASKGLELGATVTQGLGLGDMFRLDDAGRLQPVLQALAVPVRAIVLPLRDASAASVLLGSVKRHLAPLVPGNGIWLQDSGLYHSTIYHASTHTDPVPATADEVDGEEAAIRAVGRQACPLRVVLERVVATPAGVVVACWQVAGGTDVFELRRQLSQALPHASRQQIVRDHSILHTTLARIVTPPRAAAAEGEGQGQQLVGRRAMPASSGGRGAGTDAAGAAVGSAGEAAALLQAAVDEMTAELCGLQAVLDDLWFAEEFHKLALALDGRVEKREVPLQCAGGAAGDGAAGGGQAAADAR